MAAKDRPGRVAVAQIGDGIGDAAAKLAWQHAQLVQGKVAFHEGKIGDVIEQKRIGMLLGREAAKFGRTQNIGLSR